VGGRCACVEDFNSNCSGAVAAIMKFAGPCIYLQLFNIYDEIILMITTWSTQEKGSAIWPCLPK